MRVHITLRNEFDECVGSVLQKQLSETPSPENKFNFAIEEGNLAERAYIQRVREGMV